jgi:GNAT superfamily N-acetyltransferase
MDHYSIKQVDFTSDTRAFSALTFSAFAPLFKQDTLAPSYLAHGVYYSEFGSVEVPVGLVLGSIDAELSDTGKLNSLFVSPKHRFKGLGKKLLKVMEKQMKARGAQKIEAVYSTSSASFASFEAILRHQGWSPPLTRMYLFFANLEKLRQASWFSLFQKITDGYRIVPWAHVTENQKLLLKDTITNTDQGVSPEVSPFEHEQKGLDQSPVLQDFCLACLFRDQVVGWHFTHRIRGEIARFSCSYVLPVNQSDFPVLSFWVVAFEKMYHSPWKKVSWGVSPRHSEMLRFNQKVMADYVDQVIESKQVCKSL